MSKFKTKFDKFIMFITENKHIDIFMSSFMTWSLMFLYAFIFTRLIDDTFIKNHPDIAVFCLISGTFFVLWIRTKSAYDDGYLNGRIDVYKEIQNKKRVLKNDKESSEDSQQTSDS